jgi:hypothetical protein
MNEALIGFSFVFVTIIVMLLVVLLTPPTKIVGKSPSPIPNSPVRIGYLPRFSSKQIIVSSDSTKTFRYISNPLSDGTSGYLTYNNDSNMLRWPFSLPLNFTHAMFNQKVFKFRRPNSSDTYGSFEDGTIPPNSFMNSIDLGTFS